MAEVWNERGRKREEKKSEKEGQEIQKKRMDVIRTEC